MGEEKSITTSVGVLMSVEALMMSASGASLRRCPMALEPSRAMAAVMLTRASSCASAPMRRPIRPDAPINTM